jgi:hypothetical protein
VGSGLDQGSILVTVIVTLPAMDFHNQFFPVDIVCGKPITEIIPEKSVLVNTREIFDLLTI